MTKVNLSLGNDIRNGYVNVVKHPIFEKIEPLPDSGSVVIGDPFNLNPLFEDNSLDEIIFCQPMNVIDSTSLVKTLLHWYSKLKSGGILKCFAIDIRPLAKALSDGSLSLQEGHGYIFGPANQYKCLMDSESLKFIIANLGLSIETVSLRECFVNIEAVKIEAATN